LLARGDRVLVAVSGGPDSVALLQVLYELRQEFGLQLEVAHLQHGIRGEEAREDARFVGEFAESLKLPFHLREINLLEMKSAAKGNLEAMAREERYEFFAAVARERGIGKVATAHTQDDQAETILMWLLRGSGRKGLSGMTPIHGPRGYPGVTIVRPLLEVSKVEILDFLRDKGVAYRVDRSNQDLSFLRNWIRLELIPQLKERIDPNLVARISQQAEIFRAEEVFLEELSRVELDRIRNANGISRGLFLERPKAMQRRLLRLWIEEVRGDLRGIDFGHVEEILRLISAGPPQGRLAIPGGWEFIKEYGTLTLEERSSRLKPLCYSYEYRVGADLKIREAGIIIHSKRIGQPASELPRTDMEAVFDAAFLPETLIVRNFRRGDRFRPLGMDGHKKVKDLFIEKKVPISARSKWPLLSMGEEILWIPGHGRSELGKIGPQTRQVWHFRAVPSGD
jgi:tRNA(Ile)-lysidine synthase